MKTTAQALFDNRHQERKRKRRGGGGEEDEQKAEILKNYCANQNLTLLELLKTYDNNNETEVM